MSEQKLQARVYSRTAPTEEQLAQLRDFLHQKYQRPVNLHWERDDRMKDGFRLELGEGESRELHVGDAEFCADAHTHSILNHTGSVTRFLAVIVPNR